VKLPCLVWPDRHPVCRAAPTPLPPRGAQKHTRLPALPRRQDDTPTARAARDVRSPAGHGAKPGQPTGVRRQLASLLNTLWLVLRSPRPAPSVLLRMPKPCQLAHRLLVSLVETRATAGPPGHLTRHPSTHYQLAHRPLASLADQLTGRDERLRCRCAIKRATRVP
jgi:hypothetical protein